MGDLLVAGLLQTWIDLFQLSPRQRALTADGHLDPDLDHLP